jgi:hypothetical protein
MGFRPYQQKDMKTSFVSLTYTQKPPNDLIEIVGTLLETNSNSARRKEQRIIIDDVSLRKLGMKNRNVLLKFSDFVRNGILRDISFAGAKVIVAATAAQLADATIELEIFIGDSEKPVSVPGKVVRSEALIGREDIASVALHFIEERVPLEIKTAISLFLSKPL